jgi:uncharacterized protein involved in exopolysaccharide biosynthesis
MTAPKHAQSGLSDWYASIQLKSLIAEVKRRRIVLGAINGIVMLAGIVYLAIAPAKYQAEIVVVPNYDQEQNSPGLGISSISSILTGTNNEPPDYANFQTLLSSVPVAKLIIDKHPEYLQRVFEKEWDPATKSWSPPRGLIASVERAFYGIVGRPTWQAPNAYRLSQYISDHVDITQLGENPIHQITYRDVDPVFAQRFISAVQSSDDELLKIDRRHVLAARAAHLLQLAQTTNIVEYRDSLMQLLTQTESQLSTLGEDFPYAALILQPAWVTPSPVAPNPLLVLFGALVLGLVSSSAFVIYSATRVPSEREAVVSEHQPLKRAGAV